MKKTFTLITLLTISLSIFAGLPNRVLVGYWHNWESLRLTDIDDRYNVLMLSFLEADKDGYQDNNSVNDLEFVPKSKSQLIGDIATVQGEGKFVLMSIGGANGSFILNSDTEKNTFVSKVKTSIQTYGVDGIDIDIERTPYLCNPSGSLSNPNASMQRLIDGVREVYNWYQSTYGKKMILTCAPEVSYTTGGISPWGDCNGAFLPFIEQLRNELDLLMIQLYNSGDSYSLAYPSNKSTYKQGTPDFIITQTEAAIEGFKINNPKLNDTYSGLPESKVVVALPACSDAGSGYMSNADVNAALSYLMGCGPKPGKHVLSNNYPNLRGLMTWSANNDAKSSCGGTYTFAQTFSDMECPVSTTKVNTDVSFSMQPNPATSILQISSNGKALSIFDINGKTVLNAQLNTSTSNIDISALTSGVYFVKVDHEVKKLVVE